MQIVIEIDEDTYRYMQSRCKYQNKGDKGLSEFEKAGVAIKNGKPLPKGHGRLKDVDAFEYDIATLESDSDVQFEYIDKQDVADAPTIIKGTDDYYRGAQEEY